MKTQRLTEYERRRLENIKRNDEMLGSFKIKSKLADLTAFTKLHRVKTNISHKVKPKIPTVTRRSLRAQGKVPDSTGLKDKVLIRSKLSKRPKTLKSKLPTKRLKTLISQLKNGDVHARVKDSIDLDSMKLAPKNISYLGFGGIISSIKFFPSTDMRMVVVGNKFGTVRFWNVDSENEDGDGIYKYHTNQGLVSAILIQPFSMNKITTSCYGGQILSLDIEKETLALSYLTDSPVTSMSQQPGDVNSLYFGEGKGVVCQWDQRSRKSIVSWDIHESIVNTIDFNPENTNIMATSSSDKTACIWDLRKLSKSKPDYVKLIVRESLVDSAYFSPSGSFLATTSVDDKIGVLSGTNYDEEFMITHKTQTSTFFPSFNCMTLLLYAIYAELLILSVPGSSGNWKFGRVMRAGGIWGWDDSYIFVGNKKKGVDVISAYTKTLVTTLESPHMSKIPAHLDAHPFIAGMLAGASRSGHVYVWTS
ncbi:WD repeat-containing protein 76 [Tanacetum coccineum]